MKPLTPEEREHAGAMLYATAQENAVTSLLEKYGKTVLEQGYLDLHPEYLYFLLASGENALNDLQNDREYTAYGLSRPATDVEAQAIYDECFEGWLLARKQQNAGKPSPFKKKHHKS